MIKRYPHKAYLIDSTTSVQDDHGNFIESPFKTEIKGRYEPNNQSKSLDYSAKFYCKKTSFEGFNKDETTLEYDGRKFTITQLFSYQNHTELWLS